MKILNKLILAFIITLMFAACSKDRLKEETPSVLTADLLFQNKDGFELALNGLHDEVRRYRSGQPFNNSPTSTN
ncbi:MAG: hypothetical protein WKF85_03380, partial [Chitinophagaceae bacterium]